MLPSDLIPAADAIPAAPWLFRGLLDLTFAVHLLLMNVMLGLALLGFIRSFRPADGLGRQAGMLPAVTALAVNVGVAPLLFLQTLYGQFLYVSATLMAVWWFGLVLAVMAAYGLAYRQKYLMHAKNSRGPLLWGLISLLLLYASQVQTHNAVLLVRPELWKGYFDNPSGTLTAWADPTFFPRWLHFVAASLAMGGLTLAMTGFQRSRNHDPGGPALTAEGLAWLGWATLVQVVDGVWFLASLPRSVMLAFMGVDHLATGLLLAGIAGAAATAAFAFKGKLMASAAAILATVGVMTVMRDILRQLYLAPYFDPDKLPVRLEHSTLAMFLGCFVLSLLVVVWASRHPRTDPKGA